MDDRTKEPTPDLSEIEQALDALLVAIVAEDMKPREPVPFQLISAAELMAAPRMTQLEMDAAELQRQPVRAACKQAVRRLGERLFKLLGSTAAMVDVAERVADLVPAQYGHRASILDSAWNGIGAGDDRWWS